MVDQNAFATAESGNFSTATETTIPEPRDALSLELDDKKFIEHANRLIKDSEDYYRNEKKLYQRRETNEQFRFNRVPEKFKEYQSDASDNAIWEAEAYLKPIALAKMPDIVVHPGEDGEEAQHFAEQLTKVVDADLKRREVRRVMALAFQHQPTYFTAVIKCFWDREKGRKGDYDFKTVHPKLVTPDRNAQSNDVRDMLFVAEKCKYTVTEWVMRFPDKEKQFYTELRNKMVFKGGIDETTDAGMATVVEGTEIWFTHFNKLGGGNYERTEAVGWYYGDCAFAKIKHPYWDWEGEEQVFNYKDGYATLSQMQENMLSVFQNPLEAELLPSEQIYHNHLETPEKPYIFIGYDQWGENPMDETSRIEQVVTMQKNLNKRERQVTEMLNSARGKNIWSTDGMPAKTIEELDMNDPDQDLIVKGKVNEVHGFIPGEQPSAQMIQDKAESRNRIFAKMGVNGPVRGEIQSDVATTNQIAREADFTRADDITDETINYAVEKMANWALQFIKLFYTEEHVKRANGEDGKTMLLKIKNDYVQDGCVATITASGTDKVKMKQQAMDMAKMKLTEPLSFYKDMGMSDPKGRTEKLILFNTNPEGYLAKYVYGLNTTADQAGALTQQSPQAMMDIAMIQQGQIPMVPQVIDPSYVTTMVAFLNSPEFEQVLQQFPESREGLLAFAQELATKGEQLANQPPQPPTNGAMQPPSPQTTANVGPMSANPQPGNTAQMNILPPSGQ